MNAKKAKSIRKACRELLCRDPKEREYVTVGTGRYRYYTVPQLMPNGDTLFVPVPYETQRTTLRRNCGREFYRQVKREFAARAA